jgi:hypothetical protein
MANIDICKGCGRPCYCFQQINNIFYVCTNKNCTFEGLLKIDLKSSLNNSKKMEAEYVIQYEVL